MASAMILRAQEKERARVARELHDETGQALTLLLVKLQLVADRISDGSMRQDLADLRELVVQTLDGVRRIVVDLGPTVLDQLGLVSAVEWLAERVSIDRSVRVETNLSLQDAPPRPVALALFRVAQEALTNAVRHSHAQNVSVRLEAPSRKLRLVVMDDGEGFDVHAVMTRTEESVGIYGMSERMALVGGDLAIESGAGGTVVTATVPVPVMTQ
jgi:signal transduction histidine kinase